MNFVTTLAGLGVLGAMRFLVGPKDGDWRQRRLEEDPERYAGKIPKDICQVYAGDLTNYVRQTILGKKTTKIPANLHGEFVIDGHSFVLMPGNASSTDKYGRKFRSSKHRLFYKATDGTLVPTGRMHQSSVCGHTSKRTRGPKGKFTGRIPRR